MFVSKLLTNIYNINMFCETELLCQLKTPVFFLAFRLYILCAPGLIYISGGKCDARACVYQGAW